MTRLQDIADQLVFVFTMAAGIWLTGYATAEHVTLARLKAEAACPAGYEAWRRTVHLDGDRVTVKCDYRRKT